jgi:hypothetical protein
MRVLKDTILLFLKALAWAALVTVVACGVLVVFHLVWYRL